MVISVISIRFISGHDTTASAIIWALNSLAKYPKMQQRVREEIEEILEGRKFLEVLVVSILNVCQD